MSPTTTMVICVVIAFVAGLLAFAIKNEREAYVISSSLAIISLVIYFAGHASKVHGPAWVPYRPFALITMGIAMMIGMVLSAISMVYRK